MAAAVKKKKKEKGSDPNIVLIIFVVFLFLVTIGLGILVYNQADTQRKLVEEREGAKKALKAEKDAVAYNSMLARELRLAVGDALTEKEMEQLNVDRGDFWKSDYGRFRNEESREAVKKLLEQLRDKLGIGDNDKDFKSNFDKETKAAETKIKDLKGQLAALTAKQKYLDEYILESKKRNDEFFQQTTARIQEGSDEALKEIQKKSESYLKVVEANRDLNTKLTDKEDEINKLRESNDKEMRKLTAQMKALDAQLKEVAAAGGQGAAPALQGSGSSYFPLVLDISKGKPFWDLPVGKITRIDPDLRQVAINLGSAQGARPELTFNVFGSNGAGRAEKQLKGSIEIIRVIDTSTSLARITALYDNEGREILLSDTSRSRIVRESDSPIREGDLLFNLFWGTRVAVAGYVSVTGEPTDNPGEQIRQMQDFTYLLQRNGMQVDAYVDLRDGKIRGNLTNKTRYVILGEALTDTTQRQAAPAIKDAGKDKEGEDKDKDKEAVKDAGKDAGKDASKEQAGDERLKLVREAREALLKEATQKGLLLISAENFATVIGYRRARSANNPELSAFRPTLPYAGSGIGLIVDAPPRPRADEEKKDKMEEKKEKEKIHDN